jgi:aldehyde:ferredoxin oxidoreductase
MLMSLMLHRKIAFINLSNVSCETEPVPEELRKKFLGGRGINMHLLSRFYSHNIDPFSPGNPLLFGAGMLTGTLSFGSRINISARSPESGHLGDSSMGGDFGAEMVYAGFSHLVFQGRSDTPVYVFLKDNRIEFRDARHLWGLDTLQTQRQIRRELGDNRVQVACIGQAGENRVRFASVRTGRKSE